MRPTSRISRRSPAVRCCRWPRNSDRGTCVSSISTAGTTCSLSDDPVAFVVHAGQPNAPNVARFLEILMAQGIEVHQMTHELHAKTDKNRPISASCRWAAFRSLRTQPRRRTCSLFLKNGSAPETPAPNRDAEGTPTTSLAGRCRCRWASITPYMASGRSECVDAQTDQRYQRGPSRC